MKKSLNYEQTIKKVGWVTIIWNLILTVVKAAVGVLGGSTAMISDALHSGSDVFTTIIVMVGAKISGKESDEAHAYGHERFESIASIFLGLLLAGTALFIGYDGIVKIIEYTPVANSSNQFTFLALLGAGLSIVVKGVMFFYTNNHAKKINSTSLKADAWHHLSDSLSSIGSMLGIIGLMIGKGWQIADPIAAIIICLIILKVAYDIIKTAVDQLVDKSISKELENEIKDKIQDCMGVKGIGSFMSRQFGVKIYLEVEVYLDENISFSDADKISIKIHDIIEKEYSSVKHCSIYAKPYVEKN
ncbi:MAG TPA: cation diffusion facilitator family transporter [Clostridia bacterium]|nr:cation diffusion facilitator family transporter [Clostridia bacterium]